MILRALEVAHEERRSWEGTETSTRTAWIPLKHSNGRFVFPFASSFEITDGQRNYQQERGRMVQKLNPVEKVLLSLASVVLSNRISRNVFAFYALGLHAIVVSVLFSWSTESNSIENILSPGYAIPPI